MSNMEERLAIKLASRLNNQYEPFQAKRIHLDVNYAHQIEPRESKPISLKPVVHDEHKPRSTKPLTIDINQSVKVTKQPKVLQSHNLSWSQPEVELFPVFSTETSKVQQQIIENTANVIVAFESELFEWNEEKMLFAPKYTSGVFDDFLNQQAAYGSYLRRCLRACEHLREKCNSKPLISLAGAVEAEIERIRVTSFKLQLRDLPSLVLFKNKSNLLVYEIELLAKLLGCSNLNKRGVLKRIPSSIELLNRCHSKAQTLNSPILWRLIESSVRPWLVQLSFAVGCINLSSPRRFTFEMKDQHFPDLFIDYNGEIDLEQVPHFIPLNIAQAAADCYKFLVYLNYKHAEIDMDKVGDVPVLSETPNTNTIQLNHLRDVESYMYPPTPIRVEPKVNFKIIELSMKLYPILSRAQELDSAAKQIMQSDLNEFITAIVDGVLLNNGVMWSLMCDVLCEGSTNTNIQSRLNMIVNDFQKDCMVVFNDNEMKVIYKPSELMELVFGPDFAAQCSTLSAQIFELYLTNHAKLQMFTFDLQKHIDKIKHELMHGTSLRALVAATKLLL